MKCPRPGCKKIGFRSYDGYCSTTCAAIHQRPITREESSDINDWVNRSLSSDNIFDGGSASGSWD